MATKPQTHPYAVMYKDNTHVIYELTAANYDTLSKAIVEGERGVVIKDVGILVLADIRAVVKQKPVEEVKEATAAADPTLTPEEMSWVNQYREMIRNSEGGYN